jgi:presenilin-like A22 family membrane protease
MDANSFDGDEERWAVVDHSVAVTGVGEVDFYGISVDVLTHDIIVMLLTVGVVGPNETTKD